MPSQAEAVKKILVAQMAVIGLGAWVLNSFSGIDQVKALVVGGLVAIIPHAVFGGMMVAVTNKHAKQIAQVFYWGEFIKWLLTIALFMVALLKLQLAVYLLLVGYILATSVFWFALLMR